MEDMMELISNPLVFISRDLYYAHCEERPS